MNFNATEIYTAAIHLKLEAGEDLVSLLQLRNKSGLDCWNSVSAASIVHYSKLGDTLHIWAGHVMPTIAVFWY